MIKPNFNPLFYSKYVFGLASAPKSNAAQSDSSEQMKYQEETLKAQTAFRKYVDTQKASIKKQLEDAGFETSSWGAVKNPRAYKLMSRIHANMEIG